MHQDSDTPSRADPPHRLVVAEDDDDFRSYLTAALRARGYEVREAKDGAELLECLEFDSSENKWSDVCDAVVTDIRMPGITGTSFLEGMSSLGAAHRVVVMSAFPDAEIVERVMGLGASAILAKPFKLETLLAALERVSPTNPDDLPH